MKELKRDQDLIDLIKLNPHDLTISFIKSIVTKSFDPVTREVIPAKYNLDDYFLLEKGECCGNKRAGITSIGILIMNKWFVEPYLAQHVGYLNQRFSSGVIGHLDEVVASAYRKDNLSFEAYEYHLNASQSQGQLSEIVTPSYSEGTLTLPPKAAKLRKELFKKYAKELAEGDVVIANKVRDEVIAVVKEELKDDPAIENYTSGSKAKFDNSYAIMNIMQGSIQNPDGTYTVVTESYDEGISKENYVAIANSAVSGIKSRALDVAVGGTIQRTIMAMAQEEVFAGKGTDCKTKRTIKIMLRPSQYKLYIGRFINMNGKDIHLTEDNIKKYIGKTLNFYSAMTCEKEAPYYCEKCVGTHPSEFGITKIGLLAQGAGSALLNSNLKAFHDAGIKTKTVDPKSLFVD